MISGEPILNKKQKKGRHRCCLSLHMLEMREEKIFVVYAKMWHRLTYIQPNITMHKTEKCNDTYVLYVEIAVSVAVFVFTSALFRSDLIHKSNRLARAYIWVDTLGPHENSTSITTNTESDHAFKLELLPSHPNMIRP